MSKHFYLDEVDRAITYEILLGMSRRRHEVAPILLDAFDLLATAFQSEKPYERNDDLAAMVVKLSEDLTLQKFSLSYFLIALYWRYLGNAEKAAFLSALICVKFPPAPLAKVLLLSCLESLKAPETAQEYINVIKWRTPREICLEYRDNAIDFLRMGNMDLFDHYLIRRQALLNEEPRMDYITDCREKSLEVGVEARVDEWRKYISDKFQGENEEQAKKTADKWANAANKKQIANVVANYFSNIIYTESPSLVDFGCHSGTLGSMIMANTDKPLKYTGIDRDPEPIKQARAIYPELEFHLGGHEKLLELDRDAYVLLMSFVCCLLPPEAMDGIAEYAARRIKYIFIVEDISNMDGDFPVFRRHYMIHPYNRIFGAHGFRLIYKEVLINANQAANAIAVWKNGARCP